MSRLIQELTRVRSPPQVGESGVLTKTSACSVTSDGTGCAPSGRGARDTHASGIVRG